MKRLTTSQVSAPGSRRTARAAAVIASATTSKQRVLVSTLAELAAAARGQNFEPPAIVVGGDIVKMRSALIGAETVIDKEPP